MKDGNKLEEYDFFIDLDNIFLKHNNMDYIFREVLDLLILSNKNNTFLSGRIKINDSFYLSEDFKFTDKYHKASIYINDMIHGEINIFVGNNEKLYQENYNIIKYTANKIGTFLESEFEKRKNESIRKALDCFSNAVLITDESDIVVYVNDKLNEMFDFKEDTEVLNRPLDIVLSVLSLEDKKTVIYSELSEKGISEGFFNKDNYSTLGFFYRGRYLRDKNGKSLCKIFWFEKISPNVNIEKEKENTPETRELSVSTLTGNINKIVEIIYKNINKKDIPVEKLNILKKDLEIFSHLLNGEIILHEDDIELNSYLERLPFDLEKIEKYSNLIVEADKYIFDRLWYELELICNRENTEIELTEKNRLCIQLRINENENDISDLIGIYCNICGFVKNVKDNVDIIEINIRKNNPGQNISQIKSIENIRVLIVEDNNATFKITELFLKQRGIKNIQRASDGDDGIQKFKDNTYDIVFMDILMEEKSGIDCIKEMREYEKENGLALTPIIANSAFSDEKEIKRCFEAGCSDFLKKPINNESLIQITEKWTRK